MKRLILVRHAKSDWSLPDQEDWDRPLNPRGQRDAPEMARRLRARRLKPDRILTSPAVRAITTATIMARELRVAPSLLTPEERLYLASPADLLAVLRELGGTSRALMVLGTQPRHHRVRQPPVGGRDHRQHADLRRLHGAIRDLSTGISSTGARARTPSSTTPATCKKWLGAIFRNRIHSRPQRPRRKNGSEPIFSSRGR